MGDGEVLGSGQADLMGGASSIEAAEDACGREKGVITSQHLASTAGWTNGSRRVTKLTLCHLS